MHPQFTHRLDTRRTGERLTNVRKIWYVLVKLFLQKGDKLSIRYFLGDSNSKQEPSTYFGIAELEKYVLTRQVLDDNCTEIICPLNVEVAKIILQENPFEDEICPWWDLRIIQGQNDKIIFSSHDWGRGTLMDLDHADLEFLPKHGIDMDYLISPAFIPNNVTRIINGIPQPD